MTVIIAPTRLQAEAYCKEHGISPYSKDDTIIITTQKQCRGHRLDGERVIVVGRPYEYRTRLGSIFAALAPTGVRELTVDFEWALDTIALQHEIRYLTYG